MAAISVSNDLSVLKETNHVVNKHDDEHEYFCENVIIGK